MRYFIDTHDKSKGSFPKEELTEQQFFDQFDALKEGRRTIPRGRSRPPRQSQGW